jgi:hypothetical protein
MAMPEDERVYSIEERPITYAGPTGREHPGEHWNARILREQEEARRGMEPKTWTVYAERKVSTTAEITAPTYREALAAFAERKTNMAEPGVAGWAGEWEPLTVTDEAGTDVWVKPGTMLGLTPQAREALAQAGRAMSDAIQRMRSELAKVQPRSPSDFPAPAKGAPDGEADDEIRRMRGE